MAFRFRRSMKIAPGVRLNLTHRSAGIRIGPKGLGATVNTKGRKTVSAGIPGTGIHVSETISHGRREKTRFAVTDDGAPQAVQRPSTLGEKILKGVGVLAIIGGLIWLLG